MYCTNCSNQVDEKAVACPKCGFKPKAQRKFCNNCGTSINPEQVMCVKCGVRLVGKTTTTEKKTTAGILALVLGGIGIHKFYLGSWGWGLVYLFLCWIYIPLIVALIEGIRYLTMSEGDFALKYDDSSKSAFRW